jgi:hypothetical protein
MNTTAIETSKTFQEKMFERVRDQMGDLKDYVFAVGIAVGSSLIFLIAIFGYLVVLLWFFQILTRG